MTDIWTPEDLSADELKQWFLDQGKAYGDGLIEGAPYLEDIRSGLGSVRAPRSGRAYQFDGVDDYVSHPSGYPLQGNNGHATIFTRVLVPAGTLAYTMFVASDAPGTIELRMRDNGKAEFYTLPDAFGKNASLASTMLINDGEWHDLAVTIDATNDEINLYVDGVLEANTTCDYAMPITTSGLFLGARIGEQYFSPFHMQSVMMFDKVKSLPEIASLRDNTDTDGLVLRYNVNEEDGLTCYDSSGNGNHGTITNATLKNFHVAGIKGFGNPANVDGYSVGAFFNGTSSGIRCFVSDFATTDDAGSIRFKFSTTSSGGPHEVFASTSDLAYPYAAVDLYQGRVRYSIRSTSQSTPQTIIETTAKFDDGINHEVIIASDGASYSISVDGQEQTLNVVAGLNDGMWFADLQEPTTKVTAGVLSRDSDTSYFIGTISDLSIENEWQYKHLEWGLHGDANDTSGNGHNGTATDVGWTIIPADASAPTKDVLGGDLTYTGKAPNPVRVNVPNADLGGASYRIQTAAKYLDKAAGEPWTICMWCYAGTTNSRTFCSLEGENSYSINGNTVTVVCWIGGWRTFNLYTPYPIDRGFHLAITCDGQNGTCYIDGEIAAEVMTNFDTVTVQFDCIGRDGYAGVTAQDFRVYDADKTQEEIKAIIAGDAVTDDLAGHWPLQEGAGNTVADIGPNANHGTILDSTIANVWASKGNVARDQGIEQGGRHVGWFGGNSETPSVHGSTILEPGTASLSVTATISTQRTSGVGIATNSGLGHLSGNNLYDGLQLLQTDSFLSASFRVTSSSDQGFTTANYPLTSGVEYHCTAVADAVANELRLYVDGVLHDTVDLSSIDGWNLVLVNGPWIGDREAGGSVEHWLGTIRDVKYYLHSVTDQEASDLFNNGTDPVEPVQSEPLNGTVLDGTATNVTYPFQPGLITDNAGKLNSQHSELVMDPWGSPELEELQLPATSVMGDQLLGDDPTDCKWRSGDAAVETVLKLDGPTGGSYLTDPYISRGEFTDSPVDETEGIELENDVDTVIKIRALIEDAPDLRMFFTLAKSNASYLTVHRSQDGNIAIEGRESTSGSYYFCTTPQDPYLGRWVDIEGRRFQSAGQSRFELLIDGELKSTEPFPDTDNFAGRIYQPRIGQSYTNNGLTYKAIVSKVEFSHGARQFVWDMNEGSGITIADSGQSGLDLTIYNGDGREWSEALISFTTDGGDDRFFNVYPALVDQDLDSAIAYIGQGEEDPPTAIGDSVLHLTTVGPDFTGADVITYQWWQSTEKAPGAGTELPIAGATEETYRPTGDKLNYWIYRIATATNENGDTVVESDRTMWSSVVTGDLPAAVDVRFGVLYGENDAISGSLDLPSVNDVRLDTVFDNLSKTGTVRLPVVADVRTGKAFDSNDSKTGTIVLPAVVDVRKSTTYDAPTQELTGLLDLPSENYVRDGVQFDSLTKTGNSVLPTVAQVLELIGFGSNGTEFVGVLDPTTYGLPGEDDVRLGVIYGDSNQFTGSVREPTEERVQLGYQYGANDSLTGQLDADGGGYPSENDVRDGTVFGAGSELVGNYVPAEESVVKAGYSFGSNGTEYVGTYVIDSTIDDPSEWIGK